MTEILKPEEGMDKAVDLIKAGEVVAFPTETVYGLGANALNPEAVKKIFLAKGRPNDNPLIVHIAKKNQLKSLVKEIPEKAEILISKFWPGPLSIIFEKSNLIPNEVSCGLSTVAIRMPENKIALELISKSFPLAAPSANSSGKPSPVTAKHVYDDLNEKIELILDGGQTEVGLESTVISLVGEPILLRPGKITLEELKEVLGEVKVPETTPLGVPQSTEFGGKEDKPICPGMKYRHYSPEVPVILTNNVKEELEKHKDKKVGLISFEKFDCEKTFIPKDLEDLGTNLFSKLREFDKIVDLIIVEKIPETGFGLAIMNRLKKAASQK